MKKFKLFFSSIEREENWINSQIKKGYRLKKVTYFSTYEFEKASEPFNEESKTGIVRMDYRHFKNDSEKAEYLTLFEDSGWHLASSISGVSLDCLYFEKTKPEADDDIFSDSDSRAERYRRVLYEIGATVLFCIWCFFINLRSIKRLKYIIIIPFVLLVINFLSVLKHYLSEKKKISK